MKTQMIKKMNKLFNKYSEPAIMNEKAVIVNCGKMFKTTVTAIENTLKSEGVKIGESYWNDNLKAYIIPVVL